MSIPAINSPATTYTWSLGQATIGGTLPVWYEYDYTHPDVTAEYQNDLSYLANFFNATSTGPTTYPINPQTGVEFTQSDIDQISAALNDMKTLAVNGLTRSMNNEGDQRTFFLTKDEVTDLDLLIRSFQAAGVTDPTSSITLAQALSWKDLSLLSPAIQNIMSAAQNTNKTSGSLQSLIELQYVATGNQVLEHQLSSLQSALGLTQDVLATLTTLQNIRNKMIVDQPGNFSLGLGTTDPGQYQRIYNTAASRFFQTPIIPRVISDLVIYSHGLHSTYLTPIGLTNLGTSIFNQLIAIKRSLMVDIGKLHSVATSNVLTDPNSLYNQVKNLVHDFSTGFGFPVKSAVTYSVARTGRTIFPLYSYFLQNGIRVTIIIGSFSVARTGRTLVHSAKLTGRLIPAEALVSTNAADAKALYRYLLDNNDPRSVFKVAGKAPGDSQQALTTTTTAGQNLNDTQKTQVQQDLFLFEEFYKSASSILQSITQIIQKMAQNISS